MKKAQQHSSIMVTTGQLRRLAGNLSNRSLREAEILEEIAAACGRRSWNALLGKATPLPAAAVPGKLPAAVEAVPQPAATLGEIFAPKKLQGVVSQLLAFQHESVDREMAAACFKLLADRQLTDCHSPDKPALIAADDLVCLVGTREQLTNACAEGVVHLPGRELLTPHGWAILMRPHQLRRHDIATGWRAGFCFSDDGERALLVATPESLLASLATEPPATTVGELFPSPILRTVVNNLAFQAGHKLKREQVTALRQALEAQPLIRLDGETPSLAESSAIRRSLRENTVTAIAVPPQDVDSPCFQDLFMDDDEPILDSRTWEDLLHGDAPAEIVAAPGWLVASCGRGKQPTLLVLLRGEPDVLLGGGTPVAAISAQRARYRRELHINHYWADTLATDPNLESYFLATVAAGAQPVTAMAWIAGEICRVLSEQDLPFDSNPVTPEELGELLARVDADTTSVHDAAKELRELLHRHPRLRLARKYRLPEEALVALTREPENIAYFDAVVAAGAEPRKAADWICDCIIPWAKSAKVGLAACPVTAADLGALLVKLGKGTISTNGAWRMLREFLK